MGYNIGKCLAMDQTTDSLTAYVLAWQGLNVVQWGRNLNAVHIKGGRYYLQIVTKIKIFNLDRTVYKEIKGEV